MKNSEYWRGRFAILENAAKKQADQCISSIEWIYRDAERTIQADLERWYGRFAANNGMSLTEAKKILTIGQLEEFRWTVDQYIQTARKSNLSTEWIKKLENASAKFHISRLETIQLQIQQQLELLYGNQTDSIDELLKKVVADGYTYGCYEIQRGLGIGWNVTALNQKRLETLLSKPWTGDNKTFRDRCWEGKANLVSGIQTRLIQALLRGDSLQKTTDAIRKQFGVARYKAGRLVHTETTYFNAVANRETYKEIGVEMAEIIGTLDSHTCELCGEMDGKTIPMSQYDPGITVPPWHPNCRCTTAPAIDPDIVGERVARDVKTGESFEVPRDMTYKEWKAKQDELHGEGTVDKERKKNYNKSADKLQFERYKSLMDGDFPATFEAFQKLKYDNPELWESYKTLARSKNYLQQKLDYVWNGEKSFIPKHTKFEKVVTMAGKGTDTAIRCVDRLVETYGGKADEWQKRAGKVTSNKYIFDLHWYESDGVQYEVKLKNKKERKRYEN